jgi:hypothetical protein
VRVSIGRSKKVYICSHVKIDYWDDGIDVELFEVEVDGKKVANKLIEMPEDGKLVRVMNDQGEEINRLEWKDD